MALRHNRKESALAGNGHGATLPKQNLCAIVCCQEWIPVERYCIIGWLPTEFAHSHEAKVGLHVVQDITPFPSNKVLTICD